MEQADKLVNEAKEKAQAVKMQADIDVKKTKDGIITLPTFRNAVSFLNTNPSLKEIFKYNEFSHIIEIGRTPPWGNIGDTSRPISDFDTLSLKDLIIKQYQCEISVSILNEAINFISKNNSYNPVKEYLSGLKWDGKSRIDSWLTDYLGVERDAYTDYVGKLHLVAAVARVFNPGCIYHYMLIIEGDQGIGKSRTASILGGQWYRSVSLLGKNQDIVEKMQGAWIIEVAELAALKKRDVESLKDFISNERDIERLSYDRRISYFPRHSVFIGTINPDNNGYLADTTGNRRFLPVRCSQRINTAELQRDKDQLWAEAVAYFKSNPDVIYKLYLPQEIEQIAIQYQEARQTSDDWEEKISSWLETKNKDRVSGIEIWTECMQGFASEFDRMKQMRIANCMRRLRWDRKTLRHNGKISRGYYRPDLWQHKSPWAEEEEWK